MIHLYTFSCQRERSHSVVFIFWRTKEELIKIGQYPSLADLDEPKIRGYRKILGQEKYKELHRAVGLASHGVGIGSFVYLRRIFEHVIEEAHRGATKKGDWNEGEYQGAGRMEEKINLLKDHLPPFLVRSRGIYAILSKAIHELDEGECLAAYPVIRAGIELILDAWIEQERQSKKEKEAGRSLTELRRQLSQDKSG